MDQGAEYTRLILSDIHLGSLFCQEEKLYQFLQTIEFDELILAGDIIDFIKIPTFTKHTALLLEFIAQLPEDCRVIYIVGNHDFAFRHCVGSKVGKIEFMESYDFQYCGRKYRVEHGHKYEKGIVHWRFLMNVISVCHDVLERWLNLNLAAWWVKMFEKKHQLKRIWDIICWNDDADVFIMGHTHQPEAVIWVDKYERIRTYVNTGDWVENNTYVLIKEGDVRLKCWGKNDTRDTDKDEE